MMCFDKRPTLNYGQCLTGFEPSPTRLVTSRSNVAEAAADSPTLPISPLSPRSVSTH